MKKRYQIIITAIIFLLIGFVIGEAVGTYVTLRWVSEKAVHFFELQNNTLNINAKELAGALGRYKKVIDGVYPTSMTS